MKRRNFLSTLFGLAVVPAVVVKVVSSYVPAAYSKITGLYRRVFPPLVAKELVQVRPMSEPSGTVYYMGLKYTATTKKHEQT